MVMPMTVTDTIRKAIEQADASYREIFRACGVEPATISRFVRGERKLDANSIDALATHFNLELRPAGKPTARKGKATK